MADEEAAVAEDSPPPVEMFRITFWSNAYYRWMQIPPDQVKEGDVTIASTIPGMVARRETVHLPEGEREWTTSDVNIPQLKAMNADREAAGLPIKPHISNLIAHLEDGPLYRHVPPGSIVDVEAEGHRWEGALKEHFVNQEVD